VHRTLTPAELARDLAIPDLTDPDDGPHALQALVDLATTALVDRWACTVRRQRGPRAVSVADNYDRLGFRSGDVTRDARYTRYVDDDHLLRSHTSALVPPGLRGIAAAAAAAADADGDGLDDVLLVAPGITYRRDAIDRLHTGTPHQLDLWRVRRARTLTPEHLDGMIDALVKALLPGHRHRCEPRVHPYTLAGRQIDVHTGDEWVEIGECGLAHPDVLAGAGLDPATWSGLAMGLGLDRLLMVRKGVPDIRLLRSTDPRVAGQMLDLAPYRPVSHLPPVRRDLSVAVPADDTAEDLGDRVRAALGVDADLLEAVGIVSETPGDQLPPAAIERLGLGPGQKNVLVRLVIRPYERTLTDAEANRLRDRVHAAIHQGSVPLTA
jgi:phenylalanyl-tRNA synthetase alpha chain